MVDLCGIRNCPKPYYLKRYCRPHYEKMLKYGDPLYTPRLTPPVERFLAKVTKAEEGECWQWQPSGHQRYGNFWDGRKQITAHRFAYMTFVGLIPRGAEVHHKCHNTRCVNPDHLEAIPSSLNHGLVYTHRATCKNGHPFSLIDTRFEHGRNRVCRICKREAAALYRLSHSAS